MTLGSDDLPRVVPSSSSRSHSPPAFLKNFSDYTTSHGIVTALRITPLFSSTDGLMQRGHAPASTQSQEKKLLRPLEREGCVSLCGAGVKVLFLLCFDENMFLIGEKEYEML